MEHKLDNIDRKIIEMLQKNARTPVKEIAKEVFLSSPAVSARIEHLEKNGLITGYHAQINPVFLGYHIKAFINLEVEPNQKKRLLSLHPVHPKCHRMQLRHRRLLHAHRSSLPLHHGTGPLHQRTPAVRPHQNTDRILHQRRTQRSAGGVTPTGIFYKPYHIALPADSEAPRPPYRQTTGNSAFPPSYPAQR